MLTFTPISELQAGTIAFLLIEGYAALLVMDAQYWEAEKDKWLQFDRASFENPDTIGKCVFFTSLGDGVIGFGSFDPRQGPEYGIIVKLHVLYSIPKDLKRLNTSRICSLPYPFPRNLGRMQLSPLFTRLCRFLSV